MIVAFNEQETELTGGMMRASDEMLRRTIGLTEEMIELADLGDGARKDAGCGVLYGLLRDSAYKIKKIAQNELEEHLRREILSKKRRTSVEIAPR